MEGQEKKPQPPRRCRDRRVELEASETAAAEVVEMRVWSHSPALLWLQAVLAFLKARDLQALNRNQNKTWPGSSPRYHILGTPSARGYLPIDHS